MAESLCFDDGTHSLLQRLHEAWSNNAPASTFAAIRDSLLGQRDHLDTHISTLSAVTKIACARHGFKLDDADARWDDFFALAAAVRSGCEANSRKRKRAYNETNRLRNLALVAALWSPDLVFHYGWNSASQVQMNMLRACATRYPRFFHDFRPRLNAVLLERHRRAIQHRRAKTLNEAPLQPHRDFDLVTLASAVPDGDVENRWVTSEDGQVPVDAAGTLLKDLRPDHYQIYLLRRDRYGLLAARGEECAPSSPPAIEPPLPPPPPPLPPLPPSEPTTNPAGGPLAEAQGASSYEFQAHCNVDITFDPSAPHISAPSPDSEFLQALLEGIRLPDSDATMASSDMSLTSATSATSATDYDAHIDIDFDAALHDEAGCASSAFVGPIIFDDFDPQDASHLVASLDAANPGQATVLSPDSRDLRLGSSPTIGQDALTVEEALHSRYHDLIAAYVQRVASEAEQAGAGDWRKPRAQWLSRCTRWASVYTEPESGLPRGGAPSRAEADVLYLTSDEALRAAQKGDVFRRPVVIKEKFSDSGMHTIHECALLLQGASANAVVDVHNTPAATCVDTLLQCLHTNDVAHGGGLDAITLNLRNITRSHRPLLLMLPRFRLLDSLVERLRGGRRGGDQPPPEPPQVDMTSRTSFNTLSLAGAFSGARLAAMSGVWMRNLDGVKFCTFVPEDATVPEREALAETGAADWSPPDGRQRFVVLEQDDVLLIPPGVRVAYSLHSPTSGVMEGGIFWDNLNLVQMLRSAHWICCAHGLARDEAVAGQLPLLVAELEGLVRHRPDRFRGGRSESDFVRAFGLAVSELAEELRCRGAL